MILSSDQRRHRLDIFSTSLPDFLRKPLSRLDILSPITSPLVQHSAGVSQGTVKISGHWWCLPRLRMFQSPISQLEICWSPQPSTLPLGRLGKPPLKLELKEVWTRDMMQNCKVFSNVCVHFRGTCIFLMAATTFTHFSYVVVLSVLNSQFDFAQLFIAPPCLIKILFAIRRGKLPFFKWSWKELGFPAKLCTFIRVFDNLATVILWSLTQIIRQACHSML